MVPDLRHIRKVWLPNVSDWLRSIGNVFRCLRSYNKGDIELKLLVVLVDLDEMLNRLEVLSMKPVILNDTDFIIKLNEKAGFSDSNLNLEDTLAKF